MGEVVAAPGDRRRRTSSSATPTAPGRCRATTPASGARRRRPAAQHRLLGLRDALHRRARAATARTGRAAPSASSDDGPPRLERLLGDVPASSLRRIAGRSPGDEGAAAVGLRFACRARWPGAKLSALLRDEQSRLPRVIAGAAHGVRGGLLMPPAALLPHAAPADFLGEAALPRRPAPRPRLPRTSSAWFSE